MLLELLVHFCGCLPRYLGVSCAINFEDSARAESEFEQFQASCCPLYIQKHPLNVRSIKDDVSPPFIARMCCILSCSNPRAKPDEILYLYSHVHDALVDESLMTVDYKSHKL